MLGIAMALTTQIALVINVLIKAIAESKEASHNLVSRTVSVVSGFGAMLSMTFFHRAVCIRIEHLPPLRFVLRERVRRIHRDCVPALLNRSWRSGTGQISNSIDSNHTRKHSTRFWVMHGNLSCMSDEFRFRRCTLKLTERLYRPDSHWAEGI